MNKYLDFESEIEILDSKINELHINDNNFIIYILMIIILLLKKIN